MASSLPAPAAAAAAQAVESAIAEVSAVAEAGGEDGEAEEAQTKEPGLITVFSDTATFNVKHPLYSTWELWFDSASKQDKAKSWDEALQRVIAFDTVEEFWGLHNNIVPPSHIHPNSNYYLFKKGIKPAWEDVANSKGGKWSVQLPRDRSRDQIDKWWLYTCLAAIGETFETPFAGEAGDATPADEVTGVIVSSRKAFYRINIWTRSSAQADKDKIDNVGKHFKYGVLGVPEGKKLGDRSGGTGIASDVEFVSHKDSMAKGNPKSKWIV